LELRIEGESKSAKGKRKGGSARTGNSTRKGVLNLVSPEESSVQRHTTVIRESTGEVLKKGKQYAEAQGPLDTSEDWRTFFSMSGSAG